MCYKHAYQNQGRFSKHHGGRMHPGMRRKFARMKRMGLNNFYAPVNIEEFDDRYEIFLAAPGYQKSDFKISIADHILTLSVSKEEAKSDAHWNRKEFSLGSFSREFELSEKIDQDKIDASYKDGILEVTLPKKEDFVTARKDIDIV